MRILILSSVLFFNIVCAADYWRPLFNGVDFTGWVPEGPGPLNGSAFAVVNGTIEGKNIASQPKHGICWSDKKYTNFKIRVKYKDVLGNSGFYFRSERSSSIVSISGMQIEIDPSRDAGSFYETEGRNWVAQVTQAFHDSVHRKNDWNDLMVEANGTHITSWVNGRLGRDVPNDNQGRLQGYFGLQTHGSADIQVFFKEIEILDSSYCETNAPCLSRNKVCDVQPKSTTYHACIEKSVAVIKTGTNGRFLDAGTGCLMVNVTGGLVAGECRQSFELLPNHSRGIFYFPVNGNFSHQSK
ncbi:MAG: DUF1080 domain-containing protein [Fibrobacterota bacterium]|nr:DUF1080 domain-containing protein [Fibrobacterota bacterium]